MPDIFLNKKFLSVLRYTSKVAGIHYRCKISAILRTSVAIIRGDYGFYPDSYTKLLEQFRLIFGKQYSIGFSSGSAGLLLICEFFETQYSDVKILMPEVGFPTLNSFTNGENEIIYYRLRNAQIDESHLISIIDSIDGQLVMYWSSLFGLPLSVRVREKLKSKGVIVVHDASHSQTARYNSEYLASYGDFVVFSLQARKTIPAGEGGVVLTNCGEFISFAQLAAHFNNRQCYSGDTIGSTKGIKGFILARKMRMNPLGSHLALPYLSLYRKSIFGQRRSRNIQQLYSHFDKVALNRSINSELIELQHVEMGVCVTKKLLNDDFITDKDLFSKLFNNNEYRSLNRDHAHVEDLVTLQPWVFNLPSIIFTLLMNELYKDSKP